MTEKISERKVVDINVAIALGIICIILAVSLVGAVALYLSRINDKDNIISSKNAQILDLQNQIASKDSQISSLNSQVATLQKWLDDNKTLLSQTQIYLQGNLSVIGSINDQIPILEGIISFLNSNIASLQNQIFYRDALIQTISDERFQLYWWLQGNLTLVSTLTDIVNLAKSEILVDSQTVSQPANSYYYWNFTIANVSYAGYVSVFVSSSTTTNTYVEVIYSAYGVLYDNKITVGASGTAFFPVLPANGQIRVGNTDLVNGATETVTIIYFY